VEGIVEASVIEGRDLGLQKTREDIHTDTEAERAGRKDSCEGKIGKSRQEKRRWGGRQI